MFGGICSFHGVRVFDADIRGAMARLNVIAKYVYENRLTMAWVDCFVEIKRQWPDISGMEVEVALAIYVIPEPDETLQSLVELEDSVAKSEAEGLITNRAVVEALWDEYWQLRGSPIGGRRD